MNKLIAAIGVVLLLWAGDTQAAGIALDVQSARSTAMAGALTGLVDDASGIFFNAAAIARGRGLDVQLGSNLIVPYFNVKTASGEDVSGIHNAVPPVHAYATYGINDALTVGIGLHSPFGLAVTWPGSYPGRFIVTSADFRTYFINPTVAYRYRMVRIGAGLDVVRATVDLKKRINLGPLGSEPEVEMGAGTWGLGGNVGIQVDVLPNVLTIGAQYRSAVKLAFDGNAHFSNVPSAFQGSLADQSVKTTFRLPDTIQLGVAYRPIPKLALDVDVWYYGWQRFGAIDIAFSQTPELRNASYEAKNWKHVFNYHIGAEYTVDDQWQVRGGFLLDPSPSPANTILPDVPDSTRMNFGIGGRYRCGAFYGDLAYQFVYFTKRTSTSERAVASGFNPATYNTTAHIVGLTVGAKLGL